MNRSINEIAKELIKDYRIMLFLGVVILSLIAIRPVPVMEEDGTYALTTNIKKGIDLEGGIRALLKPEVPTRENAEKIIAILQNRISAFGLKEARMSIVEIENEYYIDISLAGTSEEEMRELIEKQGVFEAYIDREARKRNGKYYFKLLGKEYSLEVLDNTTVEFEGNTYKLNQTFELEGFTIKVASIDDNVVHLWIKVFSGEDIKEVLTGAGYSSITQSQGIYRFAFTVIISSDAALRMSQITQDSVIVGANLNENIIFVLDGRVEDVLSISSGLKGVEQTTVQISGSGVSKEDAENNMRRLIAILQSGSLPTKIEIVELNVISPTLGKDFFKVAIYAIFAALIFVALVIFVVYRDWRISIPMVITSLTEVLAILGFASMVGWTIDLAAIAGIVAAIGTGIDDQIIVIDEAKKQRRHESLRVKLKRAFFIIFSTAATTIAAMLPLLMSNFANVKGFAFTTIVGVLVGVLITRPAFAKVIRTILK